MKPLMILNIKAIFSLSCHVWRPFGMTYLQRKCKFLESDDACSCSDFFLLDEAISRDVLLSAGSAKRFTVRFHPPSTIVTRWSFGSDSYLCVCVWVDEWRDIASLLIMGCKSCLICVQRMGRHWDRWLQEKVTVCLKEGSFCLCFWKLSSSFWHLFCTASRHWQYCTFVLMERYVLFMLVTPRMHRNAR